MKRISLLLLMSFAALLWSCETAEESGENGKPTPEPKGSIELSQNIVSFKPDSTATATIDVTASGEWTVSGYGEGTKTWLSLSAESGTGAGSVTLECTEFNPYDEDRMAVLTFICEDAQALLLVKQISDTLRNIKVSPDTLFFTGVVDEAKVAQITTAKAWTLEGMTDELGAWLTVSAAEGEGDAEITVTTTDINEELTPRLATLAFRIDRVHTAELVISQPCGIEISLGSTSLEFGADGGESKEINILCNAKTKPWNIEGVDEAALEWLSFSATSGTGNATVQIGTKTANSDAIRHGTFTVRVDAEHAAQFEVTQGSSMGIIVLPETLDFAGDEVGEKSVTVTSTTTSIPWYIEGYTDEVKTWLSIDTESAQALSTEVKISTLNANNGTEDRVATLKFHLTSDIYSTVTVTQASIALKTYVFSWKGVASKSGTPTVKGGDMSPHDKFPWVDAWTTLNSVDREWKNGYNGDVVRKGDYAVTATWLFQDNNTKEWIPLEMGPIRNAVLNTSDPTKYSIQVYYQNQENYYIRWAWAYIKLPAMPGYRITHIKMTGTNAASNATLLFGTNKNALNGFLEESANRVTFGKNDPLDREFTTTQVNTDYYLGSALDRTFDSLEVTYTEVR